LDEPVLTLGRDPRNDVVIDHPEVSRRHARIARQGDVWVIEDLESTNGTFVNGTRLTVPRALTRGDTIELSEAVALIWRQTVVAAEETREPTDGPPPWPSRDQAPPLRAYPPEPAAPSSERASSAPTAPPERGSPQDRTWLWVGAGCFVLLVAVACAAAFVLDMFGLLPAFFYEPFRWLGLI
jgi:hypothetical protein